MIDIKVLLLAQGNCSRWTLDKVRKTDFLGIKKHLLLVDGETLLNRARRLFTEAGCEVVVIGPQIEGYMPCVTLANPHPTGTEQDKFIATACHWDRNKRTIITWGDCFYTKKTVKTIVSHKGNALHYFRRTGPSKVTGHKWDESFAVSFGPHEQKRVLDIAFSVVNAIKTKKFLKKDHIRTHYAASLGLQDWGDNDLIRRTANQTAIDDWTDDFDRPDECTRWLGRYYDHKVKVAICIPWKSAGKEREASRQFVHQKYFSLAPIYYGTDSTDTAFFNRAAARNAAARLALESMPDVDVLFFADSDTFVSKEQFWAACHIAKVYERAVFAFHKYCHLSQTMSMMAMKNELKIVGRMIEGHASGALAVSVALWKKVGGYDERFGSWGGEDRAFQLACDAITGVRRSIRTSGVAYHLWHPVTQENDHRLQSYKDNIQLGIRYKQAAGRTEKMGILPNSRSLPKGDRNIFAILNEPGGPLNPSSKSEGVALNQNPLFPQTIGPHLKNHLRNHRGVF